MKMVKQSLFIAAAISAICLMFGCGPSKPVLNVYNWSDYIDMDMVKAFEKENNCTVRVDTFDSNELMYSKIKSGADGYDIVVPTSYMAKIMYAEKLIDKLDLGKLGNAKANINKKFLEKLAFDKNMEYCVPYLVSYTCVAYNKDKVGKIENTWDVFSKTEYKSRMTMLDDFRESIGAALKFLGYSMNTTDDAALAKAKEQLLKWKKNLAKFDNEVYKNGLSSGEFYIVQGYSGDLFQIFEDRKDLDFMIPKEGTSISSDNLAILSASKNKELAYKFIDFLCRKDVAAKNMEVTYYHSPVDGALELVDKSLQNHPGLKLSDELYNAEIILDLGDNNNKLIKLWDEVKLEKVN